MITTNKQDVLVSYIAYFFRITSNIILLPIILKKMPATEYGLWNIYVSVGALVLLIDMGFATVLVRYITYAYCGAKDLPKQGLPETNGREEPNYELFFQIFFSGKRIYKKLFYISLVLVSILGVYILKVNGNIIETWKIILSWGIYGLATAMYLYYVAYNCIIKGIGKLKESHSFYIIQQIIYLILAIIFLWMGWGILAVALANFIATLVFRVMNVRFIYRMFGSRIEVYKSVSKQPVEEYKHIYDAIKDNTKGLGIVTVSNYILNYGGTIICSAFVSLGMVASYGLTNQLIGVIASLSSMPFSLYMPKLGEMQINGQTEKIKNYYSCISIFQKTMYLLGGIALVSIGEYVLRWYGSNTLLLSRPLILLMTFSSFISNNHQHCTSFIMLGNRQPHVKAYFISSILTLFMSVIFLCFFGDIFWFITIALVIQLAYNAWKWPKEVMKQLELSQKEKRIRCYQCVYNTVKNMSVKKKAQ